MGDQVERAAEVLVAHQRRDIGSCLCGWGELGQSHAVHVAQALDRAGLLAAPVDADLREALAAILFDRTWSSIREDALPPEEQVWEAVRADVDALMPAITAHVHDEARGAQQRLLSWLAQTGQGRIKGDLLLEAEQAIEAGRSDG